MSNRYELLLSPIQVGNVLLKNRMVSTAGIPHMLQGPEEYPTDRLISHLSNRAKNGAAAVYLNFAMRTDEGPGGPPPKPGEEDDEDEGGMFGPMEMPDPTPIANGPFYALFIKLFHENAVGGMATDSDLRVLKQDQPIAGLYAAGDNIRGIMLPGEIGVAYIEGVLSALTVAFSSGYLAGNRAVEFCG